MVELSHPVAFVAAWADYLRRIAIDDAGVFSMRQVKPRYCSNVGG